MTTTTNSAPAGTNELSYPLELDPELKQAIRDGYMALMASIEPWVTRDRALDCEPALWWLTFVLRVQPSIASEMTQAVGNLITGALQTSSECGPDDYRCHQCGAPRH